MTELLLTAAAPEFLQDVERAYRVAKRAAKVSGAFDPRMRMDPKKVFRSHMARKGDYIVEPDVSYRNALDLLLGGLSALHAGGLGAGPERDFSDSGGKAILALLSEPAIRDYYEKHYPFAPPTLVRHCAAGTLASQYCDTWAQELGDERFDGLYRQFLHLDARFIADDVIGDFLALLDDYYVYGEHLEDVSGVLRKPERLKKWLEEDEDRWRLLEGMESFYEFALDLDAFLQRADLPFLRGHAWLHFAYWFGSGGSRMLQVAGWLAHAAAKVDGNETDETAASVIAALERLRRADTYALPVLLMTDNLLERWLKHSGAAKQATALSAARFKTDMR
jgi:hypothetical protein